jgi:small subunit ribosomal protein S9
MVKKTQKYFEGVGRRKTSIARVRISEDKKNSKVVVNKKELKDFFPTQKLIDKVTAPLEASGTEKQFSVSVKVRGGGITGQADAIRMALSRALVKYDGDFFKTLKDLDYLRRDSRKKERKKPGLKKARRAPQWQKR